MTVVLVALATILVLLVLIRINARPHDLARARSVRDQRSGRDRRVQRCTCRASDAGAAALRDVACLRRRATARVKRGPPAGVEG